jgi:hypothetical protein
MTTQTCSRLKILGGTLLVVAHPISDPLQYNDGAVVAQGKN